MAQPDYEFTLRTLKRERKYQKKWHKQVRAEIWKVSLIEGLEIVRSNMFLYCPNYDAESLDAVLQTLEGWTGTEAEFENYLESKTR